MRTEMSRDFGSVTLHASVTAGAIIDISRRFGDMQAIARMIDGPHPGNVIDMLIVLVSSGDRGLARTDAQERVYKAFEEAGTQALRDFLGELMAHAHAKATEFAGKPQPGQ